VSHSPDGGLVVSVLMLVWRRELLAVLLGTSASPRWLGEVSL